MLVFFALAPLGLILGLSSGWSSLCEWRDRIRRFAKAQGLQSELRLDWPRSFQAFSFLAADHPPKLDGKPLALEFELKIPPALKLPAQPSVRRCTPVFTPTTGITATPCSITTRSQVTMATLLFRAKRRCSRKLLIAICLVSIEAREEQVSLLNSSWPRSRAKKRSMVGLDNGDRTRRS